MSMYADLVLSGNSVDCVARCLFGCGQRKVALSFMPQHPYNQQQCAQHQIRCVVSQRLPDANQSCHVAGKPPSGGGSVSTAFNALCTSVEMQRHDAAHVHQQQPPAGTHLCDSAHANCREIFRPLEDMEQTSVDWWRGAHPTSRPLTGHQLLHSPHPAAGVGHPQPYCATAVGMERARSPQSALRAKPAGTFYDSFSGGNIVAGSGLAAVSSQASGRRWFEVGLDPVSRVRPVRHQQVSISAAPIVGDAASLLSAIQIQVSMLMEQQHDVMRGALKDFRSDIDGSFTTLERRVSVLETTCAKVEAMVSRELSEARDERNELAAKLMHAQEARDHAAVLVSSGVGAAAGRSSAPLLSTTALSSSSAARATSPASAALKNIVSQALSQAAVGGSGGEVGTVGGSRLQRLMDAARNIPTPTAPPAAGHVQDTTPNSVKASVSTAEEPTSAATGSRLAAVLSFAKTGTAAELPKPPSPIPVMPSATEVSQTLKPQSPATNAVASQVKHSGSVEGAAKLGSVDIVSASAAALPPQTTASGKPPQPTRDSSNAPSQPLPSTSEKVAIAAPTATEGVSDATLPSLSSKPSTNPAAVNQIAGAKGSDITPQQPSSAAALSSEIASSAPSAPVVASAPSDVPPALAVPSGRRTPPAVAVATSAAPPVTAGGSAAGNPAALFQRVPSPTPR